MVCPSPPWPKGLSSTMPPNSDDEGALGTGRVRTGEMPAADRMISVALSVGLHGLVVLLLIFAAQSGIATSRHGFQWVPIDVEIGPPTKPQRSVATATRETPTRAAPGELPPREASPPETQQEIGVTPGKLASLAMLRQSDHASDLPAQQTTNDVPTPGELTVSAAKDFIRAEVERRWNLDLKKLGEGGYSVPIHVQITSSGTVLTAEIVDNERSADPTYHEIALSARSAVLLSSPFALPAGHYQDVMDMVLDLDPRETLR